jgi:hypothetical protein
MNNLWLIPILTGCLGWFLIWLFVKSFFFPIDGIQFGKFTWKAPVYHLLEKLPLESFVADASQHSFEAVAPFIDKQLEDFFRNKLGAKMPMIAMFIGDKTIAQLKSIFMEELQSLFPQLMNGIIVNGKAHLLKNLANHWIPIIEPNLLKSTRKARWIAFGIGVLWGMALLLIVQHS